MVRYKNHNIFLAHFGLKLGYLDCVKKSFSNCVWSHVCTKGNVVAHSLVKIMPFKGNTYGLGYAPMRLSLIF